MRTVKASVLAVAITSAIGFSLSRLDVIPRSVPFINFLMLSSMLLAGRFGYAAWVRRNASGSIVEPGHVGEPVLVVGANALASFYIRMIETFANRSQHVVGVLDTDARLQGRLMGGHAIIGSPDRLASILDDYAEHGVKIRRVMVAGSTSTLAPDRWEVMERVCADRGVMLRSIGDLLNISDIDIGERIAPEADAPAVAGSRAGYFMIKRGLDIVFALGIGLLTLPVALLVAVLVLFDTGAPIIFWQKRLGYRGKFFYV